MGDILVDFQNVGFRYSKEKEILKDVNLKINKGDFIFITGRSGSGKSTLLKMAGASLIPTRGLLSIFGVDIHKIYKHNIYKVRRKIGIIFQDFKLIEDLNIFENIAIALRVSGEVSEVEIAQRVYDMLEWVDMKEYANSYPQFLSGGQKQIICVCRAVITNPQLIVADEPTASIDSHIAEKVIRILYELNKQGTSVVLATHDRRIVENSSGNIFHISEGGAVNQIRGIHEANI